MMKTITVNEKVWKKLNKLKYDLDSKTIDDVISKLLDIVSKFKLAGELK